MRRSTPPVSFPTDWSSFRSVPVSRLWHWFPGPKKPEMILGHNFQLDGDLAERLASLDGLANVQLGTQRAPSLRLVA